MSIESVDVSAFSFAWSANDQNSLNTFFRQFANLGLTQDQRSNIQSLYADGQKSHIPIEKIQAQVALQLNIQQRSMLQADLDSRESRSQHKQSPNRATRGIQSEHLVDTLS